MIKRIRLNDEDGKWYVCPCGHKLRLARAFVNDAQERIALQCSHCSYITIQNHP